MTTRSDIDSQLRALEAEVPDLRKDMNNFFDAFEQRSEQIWMAAEAGDRDDVFEALEAIIARAGING